MVKKVAGVILVLMLVLPLAAVDAQGGTISVGEVIDGTLDAAQAMYELAVEAGATVSITLGSEDFDAYLRVLDGDGNVLAENDDAGGSFDAGLMFTAPETGTYLINVRSYYGDATGNYRLAVRALEVLPLEPDTSVLVTLTGADDEMVFFVFDALAGEAYNIATDDPEIDVVLTLTGPDGAQIARDDDGGEGYAAFIRGAVIPADGTYTILLEPWSSASGTVNLTLEQAPTISLADGPQRVAVGESVEGTLSMSQAIYEFSAESSAAVMITLGSNDFDTYLEVMDSAGNVLQADDDSGESLNSMLVFMPPQAGTYSIKVRGFEGDTSGAYQLALTAVAMTPLKAGASVPVTFAGGENEQAVYQFDAREGDAYNIYTDAPDIDVVLTVLDANGSEVARDDDSGEGSAAYIRSLIIPTDGTYTILLAPYSTAAGTVNLTLERGQILSLNGGPQMVTLGSDSLASETFTYEFVPGRYRLILEADGPASGYVQVQTSDFESPMLNFSYSYEASITFDAFDAGSALITLDNYTFSAESTVYTISIVLVD
jgi:hypothetical protein